MGGKITYFWNLPKGVFKHKNENGPLHNFQYLEASLNFASFLNNLYSAAPVGKALPSLSIF